LPELLLAYPEICLEPGHVEHYKEAGAEDIGYDGDDKVERVNEICAKK
jgi:hypothetical protein